MANPAAVWGARADWGEQKDPYAHAFPSWDYTGKADKSIPAHLRPFATELSVRDYLARAEESMTPIDDRAIFDSADPQYLAYLENQHAFFTRNAEREKALRARHSVDYDFAINKPFAQPVVPAGHGVARYIDSAVPLDAKDAQQFLENRFGLVGTATHHAGVGHVYTRDGQIVEGEDKWAAGLDDDPQARDLDRAAARAQGLRRDAPPVRLTQLEQGESSLRARSRVLAPAPSAPAPGAARDGAYQHAPAPLVLWIVLAALAGLLLVFFLMSDKPPRAALPPAVRGGWRLWSQ